MHLKRGINPVWAWEVCDVFTGGKKNDQWATLWNLRLNRHLCESDTHHVFSDKWLILNIDRYNTHKRMKPDDDLSKTGRDLSVGDPRC
jgi:hypothetical protein